MDLKTWVAGGVGAGGGGVGGGGKGRRWGGGGGLHLLHGVGMVMIHKYISADGKKLLL